MICRASRFAAASLIATSLLPARPARAQTLSAPDTWVGFRNSPQNRAVAATTFRDAVKKHTKRSPASFATHGLVWGTPIVDPKGNVYVGSSDKTFYAFAPDLSLRWSFTLPDVGDSLIDSAATFTPGGLVVVPGGDGKLHALNAATGAVAWEFAGHHAGSAAAGVVVDSFEGNATLGPDGRIYAGCDNGTFYCVDATTGAELWSYQTGMMIWSAPAFDPKGEWVAFGSLDKRLYVLDRATGGLLAFYQGGAEFKSSPCVGDDGRIYVGCSDASFRCLELTGSRGSSRTLVERWTYATKGELYSSPALSGDRVVFGSADGHVYCLGLDGHLLWKYATFARISASPCITSDGVVLLGAKNGKLYALDLATGERIWSYRTELTLLKVNLDSSPAFGPDQRITVGSYDGNVYSIPAEWPLQNANDPRVSTDPGDDFPDFGEPAPPADGATLRLVAADGSLHVDLPAPIEPDEPLLFRVVVHQKGTYLPNGALAVIGLSVDVTPKTPVSSFVSTDSYELNVVPQGFWQPNTHYKVHVHGEWFTREDPFFDLFKWFLPDFDSVHEFDTGPGGAALPVPSPGTFLAYSVRDAYLSQPEILDTLIPAAVEGQAFLVSLPLVDAAHGKVGALVLPAFPRPDGSVVLRADPTKAFFLNGSLAGDAVTAEGTYEMSAMGATIPMDPLRFRARFTDSGVVGGWLHETASLFAIKGNGATYKGLSWSAIDDLADPFLQLQAVGSFGGKRLAAATVPVTVSSRTWTGSSTLVATLTAPTAIADDHLVCAVLLDDQEGKIVALANAAVASGTSGTFALPLTGIDRAAAQRPGARLVLTWDGQPIR
jgi:outer membrane protein assembly factor BamB